MTEEWTPPADEGFTPNAAPVAQDIPDEPTEWSPPADSVFVPGVTPTKVGAIISHAAAGTGLVPKWSASGLKDYEQCPYRVKLAKVDKIEQPTHPAAARGVAIHNIAENYVMATEGDIEESALPFMAEWETKIFPPFQTRFNRLRSLYADGKIEVEGEWAFTTDWEITDWNAPNAWARMKLDVLEHQSDTSAIVIDHKTGRKFGNEISHANQGMIYAIGTFMRYPQLEFVETNFWYLDHDEENPQRYSREQAMMFLPRLTDRATIMTSDTQFEPKPSKFNCKWCAYNKNETCEWRDAG